MNPATDPTGRPQGSPEIPLPSGGMSGPAGKADARGRAGPTARRSYAYCSATDRTIPVLVQITPRRRATGATSYRDAKKLVCLDYGVRCTGYLCPLFDVPTLTADDLEGPSHSLPS